MCGIAGILSTEKDLNSQQAFATLADMQAAIVHRGPDGHGHFFSISGNAALCHTRLSIIDLSEAGHQPMSSTDQRYTITFNGEIYNYQTLRQELEQRGEHFASHSDTEVLLKLFQQYGPDCVKKLRGMFAFVIWDELKQCAFAARDPLGIKPLYYLKNSAGTLAFASELRSLMSAKLHSNKLSYNGLYSYFLRGTVAEPFTMLAQASLLPAGNTLTWKSGTIHTEKYWQLSFSPKALPLDKAISITRSALESTVKAHLISDVPVGIFLSGGIDSTALVALASKAAKTKLNTYSIAFESPEWNEGDVARRVSEHFGTNHTEFLLTPELAKPLFRDFLDAVDQPTTDGFNTFCVCKLASAAGEKVVLSGIGGDEFFAGYKSFIMLPKMQRLSLRLSPLANAFKWINSSFSKAIPARLQRALDFLSQPGSLTAAQQSLRGHFSQQEANALCHSMNLVESSLNKTNNNAKLDSTTLQDQISELESSTYMRNQLLRDSDVMSMACGLELRVPFVDKELLEAIAPIPAEIRLAYGKKLLVDAVPELPEWVVNRPKQGFRFPFDEWFRSQWNDMPLTRTPPAWIKLTPWYRRWSLLVLNHWQDRHLTDKQ